MASATLNITLDEEQLRSIVREELGKRECGYCKGERVVVAAFDLSTDDSYCELRTCSECSDGRRLGRSDIPICTSGR